MKICILIFIFLIIPFNIFAKDLMIVEVGIRSNSLIKIYNPTTETIDLSGYRIRRKSSTGKEYSVRVIPKNNLIPSKEYFIWATSRNDYHLSQSANIWSTITLSINNSIVILNPKGEIIDALAWGKGEGQFYLGAPFSKNPNIEQKIKRLTENNEYVNNKNNSSDFYIYPKIKENVITEIQRDLPVKENKFPFGNAIVISIFSGLVAVGIKRLI